MSINRPGPKALEAVKRILAGPSRITTVEPNYKQDPEAWAAWQAHRTFQGLHDERDTVLLMQLPADAGQVYTELMEFLMARQAQVHANLKAPRPIHREVVA